MPERHLDNGNFAELVANLGRGHRASDALPEVSVEPISAMDPAAELKRLLQVGFGQPQPAEAPLLQESQHPLLAMLHGNSRPQPDQMPRTPLDHIMSQPQIPQSPHGQHHPRAPHLDQMAPPPPYPLDPLDPLDHRQAMSSHGNTHQYMVPPQHNGASMSMHYQFPPPQPHSFGYVFPTHTPNTLQAHSQQGPRPYQRTGDPQFAQSSQFSNPAIPPASRLPPPKLNAHTLGLLNAFKMNEKPAITSPVAQTKSVQLSEAHPPMKQEQPSHQRPGPITSPKVLQSAHPHAPSPPAFQSPPPVANFQPVQPKPRNAHQDNLLSLFRAPSATVATPPPEKTISQPAELSAYPTTPGNIKIDHRTSIGPPVPDMNAKPNLLDVFTSQQKPGLTSATVRGPVNAPDFDTVKKNTQHSLNSQSRGPSPAHIKPEQKMFIPQQILRRDIPTPNPRVPVEGTNRSSNTSPVTVVPATMFKPQILKRAQQPTGQEPIPNATTHAQDLLNLFKTQSPKPPLTQAVPPLQPLVPATQASSSFDRRDTLPVDQKSALLSLFNKPSTASPTQASKSPFAPSAGSPIPPSRSPQPPTPKMLMSGVISPVSPLPEKGSQTESPANLNSRSRISSIGESIPPSIVIPRSAAPTSFPQLALGHQGNGFAPAADDGSTSPAAGGLSELAVHTGTSSAGKSPVDKNFLLGFLNDVARKGR